MATIILCVSGCIMALLVCMRAAKRNREAFEERFPPISDAEFVTRCSPGISPEVALKVRRIMADALAVEYERIYPSSRLIEDLGAE
jgi:hypothetical protein